MCHAFSYLETLLVFKTEKIILDDSGRFLNLHEKIGVKRKLVCQDTQTSKWLEISWKRSPKYEPRYEKTSFFAYAKTKTQISFAVISAFVFATRIVQSLYFLNMKFQASSHLLWLYSPVCVGPGQKPRRLVFSQGGSYCPI